MRDFVHRSRDQRIVFGAGTRATISDELDALSARRVLLVTGGSAAETGEEIASIAGERVAATFGEVAQHVPEELAQRARAAAQQRDADLILSVGGGSATGLAKAVAVDLRVPIVAVPTTYSGSEMTPIWAVTGERKRTGTDDRALPATVVYDPETTVGLPPRVSAASGLNAVAQAIAALAYEPQDPIASLYARDAIRELVASLPTVTGQPDNVPARTRVLFGACLAAKALAATGTGLHHELAHVLGGRFGLVHAGLHTVLLPHTTARLRRTAPAGFHRLSEAMSTDDPAGALFDLATRMGAPTSLAAIGMDDGDYDLVADDLRNRDLESGEVRSLLSDAHRGVAPRSDGH